MPCSGDDASTAAITNTTGTGRSRSSRATTSSDPTTISTLSPTHTRYAVRASSQANGASSTVSSGGLRLVSFAGVV